MLLHLSQPCKSSLTLWNQKGADMDGEAANGYTYEYSGCSVSLSSDGNIVAICAVYKNMTPSLGDMSYL